MKLFCMTILLINISISQDAHAVLLDQVNAYNARDVDWLVKNVTDDFKYFGLTADTLMLETTGKNAFRESMEQYFKSRKTKSLSKIESYTVVGNRISFKETVSHINSKGKTVVNSAMGIYEIRNGKIARAWYFFD